VPRLPTGLPAQSAANRGISGSASAYSARKNASAAATSGSVANDGAPSSGRNYVTVNVRSVFGSAMHM
jgi:hypothetical protein